MNKDEALRLAIEALERCGYNYKKASDDDVALYHSALSAVQEALKTPASETKIISEWMIRRGYVTGHGDTANDLLSQLDWQIPERINKAVLAEREACAKVCEDVGSREAIRERSQR